MYYYIPLILFAGVVSINYRLRAIHIDIAKMESYTRNLLEKSQRVENIIQLIKNLD